jgi:hypothetical protein
MTGDNGSKSAQSIVIARYEAILQRSLVACALLEPVNGSAAKDLKMHVQFLPYKRY